MKLDLETEIRYPEGDRAGIIRQVILDENNAVSAIVMSTDDFVSRDVIVPLGLLSEEPGGVTTINLSPEDLADLESYSEERVAVLPERWVMSRNAAFGGDVFPEMMYQPIVPVMDVPDLPEGNTTISQGTTIWCLDGVWGVVDQVLVDDGGTNYQGGYVGLESQRPFFEAAFAPVVAAFPDMPQKYTGGDRQQRPVGSDQDSFNQVGVPGFFTVETGRSNYGFVHHTQNDRFDQAIPEYLVQSSTNHAAVSFYLASLPGLLPRQQAQTPPPSK